jgi:hypothetical protein
VQHTGVEGDDDWDALGFMAGRTSRVAFAEAQRARTIQGSDDSESALLLGAGQGALLAIGTDELQIP